MANFLGNSYKQLLDCEDLGCLLSESSDELMHVQDTLMATPRSIGDFFTWGPVVTDAAWHRELKNYHGIATNITVLQPIEAIRRISRSGIPVIIGMGYLSMFSNYCDDINVYTHCIMDILK